MSQFFSTQRQSDLPPAKPKPAAADAIAIFARLLGAGIAFSPRREYR
jgi:hypothetical protein